MLLARMPSLSSFWPTVKPGEPRSTMNDGDAAVSGVGVDGGEDDEEVGFVGARDPELSARQHPFVPVSDALASPTRTHRCPSRLPRGRRTPTASGGELWQVAMLQGVVAPSQQSVGDQGVLNVNQDRRLTGRRATTPRRRERREKARTPTTKRFRDLDSHDTEIDELRDQPVRDFRLLVHFPDKGTDLAVSKGVNAIAEQAFVLRQRRQRRESQRSCLVCSHGYGC